MSDSSFYDWGAFSNAKLLDVLESLPEPILIIGNKNLDADSAGSIVALLEELRNNGKECYTTFATKLVEDLAWMFDDSDTVPTIVQDYASLIVVDDIVDSERLGVLVKPNVPVVNIDHHMGRAPEGVATDGSIDVRIVDNVIQYWANLPATACLLIDEEIYHPWLWLSLFTDSVGLTVNGITTARYLVRLADGLSAVEDPLTDSLQEEIYRKWNRIGTLHSLAHLLESKIYAFGGTYEDRPVQIIVGIIDCDDDLSAFKALGTFRAYSDVTALVNSRNGRASIRSRTSDFNVCDVAKEFGGGGHIRASGFRIEPDENFNDGVDRLLELMLKDVSNVRTKVYM